ncbi:rhodanese-like domain-containing protein [Bremerella alba]|uniref:Rhodanese domain-containing protein n=1 Tax=Bremerella alba TaxID=980252 RepID=A0A7V9A6L1_9BACT|nr:rhodanese-like domain-containing protein [Bremerella alba]MBA2114398.1 hypothetical protein [Bremerella alba]
MIRHLMLVTLSVLGTLSLASIALAVDLKEVKKEVDEGMAVLLDVREEVEWKKAHLSKAELIPLSAMATDKHARKAIAKYKKDPDLKIYAYSNTGRRAILASEMFERVDAKVIPITKTYQDLLDAGFKETKATDPQFDPPIDMN